MHKVFDVFVMAKEIKNVAFTMNYLTWILILAWN